MRKQSRVFYIICIITLTVLFLFGCTSNNSQVPFEDKNQQKSNETQVQQEKSNNILEVHFIDVGQADSILIKAASGKVMLIDAGNNGDADTITRYLKNQGVNRIDILVATHPHEDHIGGLSKIIDRFDIGKFYMPKVVSTTKTYKDVISALNSKGITINNAKYGGSLDLDTSLDTKILAPVSAKYDELNDYSIIIRLVYNKVAFLFTGDAGEASEKEILSKGMDVSSTVLKVGHHGSSTSTTNEFLNAVNPQYAVISVGTGNDYGHPEQAILNKLRSKGIKTFRTDESGTIIAQTDGNSIEFNK